MRRSNPLPLVLALTAVAACSDRSPPPTAPLAPSATPSFGKPAPTTIAVTTTIYDRDAGSNLLITRGDSPAAGFASYTEVNRMTSQISETGAWKLYIGNQSARTVYLALASNGIPVPDGYYYANVEIYSQCFDAADNVVGIVSLTAPGQSNGNCSFGMDFTSGRTKYKLAMVPTMPGTGRALVTCNAAASGSCTDWTIVPNPGVPNAGVANLYHYANNGGLVLDGVYRNSYTVRVTR